MDVRENLIACFAKRGHFLFLGSLDRGGIVQIPVNEFHCCGKHRAFLARVRAHGHNILHRRTQKPRHVLLPLACYVDANFAHRRHGERT